MGAIALLLLLIGVLVMGIAGLVLLTKAFQASILWGLAYLLVPFAALFFVIVYWHDTKKAFFYLLGGFALLMVGVLLGSPGGMNNFAN